MKTLTPTATPAIEPLAAPFDVPVLTDDEMASEILRRALRLIKDRRNWTKRAPARDREGRALGTGLAIDPEHAVSWCAYGAVAYQAHALGVHGSNYNACSVALRRLDEAMPGTLRITSGNDMPFGHRRVCKAFRKALAA